ncbi:MAG: xylose reductase [Candidatus Buchananbacteria bacterium RIFCSPLOWO2_01_FULL_40_23b]|uniref:Xylose reductase n=1 Tax=Candidatus Buchananbacteria bacterium RIFCSPLOWO2_01_FULL_40_23b TaxID=1797544 RepID=A0A1G1YMG4_9BACT|nr:MAG: xylose reductase [Candidatus Buchananbacteria bacterium RIFCSPLOWO2_01_FULL_40_23b]
MITPSIIYGTAWKEEATEELVLTALKTGFKAIDTANQRKHYHEAAVGNAIIKSNIPRSQLFLQTKFTYVGGQDHRLPYDPNKDYPTQVRQSFESSLQHLQTNYIDSYILHGPLTRHELTPADLQVWTEMEKIHNEKKIHYLGISNVNLKQLQQLYENATIKPTFVQNRCYAQSAWDKQIREYCKDKNIIYQGFSLLTANSFVLPQLQPIAVKYTKTPTQIIFRFSQQIGMIPLTGTTNQKHMQEDLALDFNLTEKEIEFIENIAVE